MKLNDKYKIEAVDHLNVCIMEYKEPGLNPKTKLPGKEGKWVPLSYHPNLEKAYESLVDHEINKTQLTDVESVVNKIKELKEFIKNGGM